MSNWLAFFIGIVAGILFGIISARKNYESCRDQLEKLEADIQARKEKLAQAEKEIDDVGRQLEEVSGEVAEAEAAARTAARDEAISDEPSTEAPSPASEDASDMSVGATEEAAAIAGPVAEVVSKASTSGPASTSAEPVAADVSTNVGAIAEAASETTGAAVSEVEASTEAVTEAAGEVAAEAETTTEAATKAVAEPVSEMATTAASAASAATRGEEALEAFAESGSETAGEMATDAATAVEATAEAAGETVAETAAPAATVPAAMAAARSADVIDVHVTECPQKLARIKGIGRVYEDRLYQAGIGTFWQVATASTEELATIFGIKDFQGVDLAAIKQGARKLAEETDTAGLTWNGHAPDDMEHLPGIGKTYEGRLYDAGVCTWAKMAALTVEELAKILRAPKWNQPDYAAWIAYAKERLEKSA